MPEEENLEEKVDEAKPKENPGKSLVSRSFDLGYHAAIAAATTALGIATVGYTAPIIGAAVAAGSMIGGAIKRDKPLDEIVNESLTGYSCINTILYPVLGFGNLIYPLIPNADLIGKAARTLFALTAHNAVFVGLFKAAKHLIAKKLNPSGIYTSVRDNFFKDCVRFAAVFAPGYALSANGIASLPILGYNVPTFAANAVPAVAYNTIYPVKKPEVKEEKPAEEQKPAIDPAQLQKYLAQQRHAA